MTQPVQTESTAAVHPFARWGFWAVVAGGLALMLFGIYLQILSHVSESSARPVGQVIGEIAGDIKRSAWRSFLGLEQPAPEPVAPQPGRWWADMIATAVPVLGGLAILLSAVSLAQRENWRFALYGVALGGGAILAQYFWMLAVLMICAILLIKILENMGDIFSF